MARNILTGTRNGGLFKAGIEGGKKRREERREEEAPTRQATTTRLAPRPSIFSTEPPQGSCPLRGAASAPANGATNARTHLPGQPNQLQSWLSTKQSYKPF
eukprot:6178479-Pleurochrysis_carterae.AAC.1